MIRSQRLGPVGVFGGGGLTNEKAYMLGKFAVDSAQYGKYAAGLAQKMAGTKEQKPDDKK